MERYEDDYLERVFVARTSGWILSFTEQGHCYFLPVMDVPESSRASRGQSIYALLEGAERGDRIVSTIAVDDLTAEDRVLVFLSRGGLIKRTALADFGNPRSGGIIAAGLRKGDRIMEVTLSDGLAEIMLLSSGGRAIRFAENEVPVVGRTAQGVKGIGLKGSEEVVGMVMVRREATVLTVTEDALGKRTSVSEFPLQKRGGMGNLVTSSGGSGGKVVAALEVLDTDEVMLVTSGGQVARVAAGSIPAQGRRTQGRQLVKLAKDDRVVEVTRSQEEGGAPAPEPLGGPDGQLDLLGG
jgi:DNA gyrase subunit A